MANNKTAIVTGGSSGIGKMTALTLAEKGYNLIINDLTENEETQELLNSIESLGVTAKFIKGDVSKLSDVKSLAKTIKKEFDSIDVLVNNAGITRDGLLLRMKEKDWDSVMDVNLKGTFLCTKFIGKLMLKQRSGKIVNITSVVGRMGNAGQSNYSASKAGVIGFTKSIAKEFASRGINVNAVAPGFIKTAMTDKLSDEVIDHYNENIPLKRMGTPEDVAKVINFLCSEDSDYITGQVINVDGGMLI